MLTGDTLCESVCVFTCLYSPMMEPFFLISDSDLSSSLRHISFSWKHKCRCKLNTLPFFLISHFTTILYLTQVSPLGDISPVYQRTTVSTGCTNVRPVSEAPQQSTQAHIQNTVSLPSPGIIPWHHSFQNIDIHTVYERYWEIQNQTKDIRNLCFSCQFKITICFIYRHFKKIIQ